jgi:hypothetical protein
MWILHSTWVLLLLLPIVLLLLPVVLLLLLRRLDRQLLRKLDSKLACLHGCRFCGKAAAVVPQRAVPQCSAPHLQQPAISDKYVT